MQPQIELTFIKPHLSIQQFNTTFLPSFTVITGINGAGKSHLLQAIKNGSIKVNDINPQQISQFTNLTFTMPPDNGVDGKIFGEELAAISQTFEGKKVAYAQIISKLTNYASLKQLCIDKDISLLELQEEDLSSPLEYQTYSAVKQQYISNLNQFTITIQARSPSSQSQSINYGHILFDIAKQLPYSIHELDDETFMKYFTFHTYSNFLLPTNLAKVFWDYHIKYDEYAYSKYKRGEPLDNDSFENEYGEKPWKQFNDILNEFDIIEYNINNPEGLRREATFHLKLVGKKDPSLTINYQTLSSGEKILFALVGLLYKMQVNQELPELVLFDEVDASLHPSMIKMFIRIIQTILIENGSNVIIVTHSPTTIALSPEEAIYVMQKNGTDRLEKKSKQDALTILTEGFATLDEGLRFVDQILNNKISIISEGKNTLFIQKACELMGYTNINIVNNIEDISGKSQLKTLFDFFCRIQHDNIVFFVWDCDVSYALQSSNNTYPYIFQLNANNQIAKKGIENLFPEELFANFTKTISLPGKDPIKEFYEHGKRDFERFVLERNQLSDFENFKALFEYINSVVNISQINMSDL